MMTPDERAAHEARLRSGLAAVARPGVLYPDTARVVVPGGVRIVVIGEDAEAWAALVCSGLHFLGALTVAVEEGEYVAEEGEL